MTERASATSDSTASVASTFGRRGARELGAAATFGGVVVRPGAGTTGGCEPVCCAMTSAGSESARSRRVASAVEILLFTRKTSVETQGRVGGQATLGWGGPR